MPKFSYCSFLLPSRSCASKMLFSCCDRRLFPFITSGSYGRFTLASCVNIFNSRRIVRKASSGASAEMLYISMVSLAATYLISDSRSAPSLYSSGTPALKNPLTPHPHKQKAPPAGFEPATSRVEAGCSNPLSYGGMEGFLPSGNFTASVRAHTTRPHTI